jgi:hypothetical protein
MLGLGISPNITVGSVPSNITEKNNCMGIFFVNMKNTMRTANAMVYAGNVAKI